MLSGIRPTRAHRKLVFRTAVTMLEQRNMVGREVYRRDSLICRSCIKTRYSLRLCLVLGLWLSLFFLFLWQTLKTDNYKGGEVLLQSAGLYWHNLRELSGVLIITCRHQASERCILLLLSHPPAVLMCCVFIRCSKDLCDYIQKEVFMPLPFRSGHRPLCLVGFYCNGYNTSNTVVAIMIICLTARR